MQTNFFFKNDTQQKQHNKSNTKQWVKDNNTTDQPA